MSTPLSSDAFAHLQASFKQIAPVAAAVYRYGKGLIDGAISALTSVLPSFAFGG